MAVHTNKLVSMVIFIFILYGFGSGLRITSDPEPFNDKTGELTISCKIDGPTFAIKSIISIQIMKQDEDTIAVIDLRQKLTMGDGSRDNMEAQGRVDMNVSKSYLTLTIDNPGRQDAGVYRCQVFYTDDASQIMEENVIGNVTFQGSGLRITSDPEPFNDKTGELTISCKTDEPTFAIKSIISIQIMKQDEDTIAVINLRQKLTMGDGSRDNMKAQGRVDTDVSKSYLTVTINNPGRQDSGVYRCQVFYTDDASQIMEENVIRNVTFQGCPDKGWAYDKRDQTCIKANYDKYLSWYDARKVCQSFGGDLVQIRDEGKNLFVWALFEGARDQNAWIGVKNHARLGYDFKYVDGSDLGSYRPWDSQPYGRGDDDRKCVAIWTSASYPLQWYDWFCSTQRAYVCSVSALYVS